jgi:dihydroxyacetone kinase
MGIHNEPGLQTLSPLPPPEEVMRKMLLFLLDPKDPDRAFVEFKPTDEVSLLINNFGGLSILELEAMTSITLAQLEKDWGIKPIRIYAGVFETSLNGPGFSISLGNLSGLARSTGVSSTEIIRLLDAPTNAPAWPKNGYATAPISKVKVSNGIAVHKKHNDGPQGEWSTYHLTIEMLTLTSSNTEVAGSGSKESLRCCSSRGT